ncbi:MAG: GxxExxY protein [Lewinella sp.]|jgi:GxxExxY protein|uniref:GxxExxY protein n=1 Tax=Lewinella sp. TaxID=2004506 RepID=UPI003D6A146D
MITKSYLSDLIYKVNGAAIQIHKTLGPGLLESAYHKLMAIEMKYQEINFISEMPIPIYYKNEKVDLEFRCDFFVENCLVVELKAVEKILPVHEAQLLTYLKLLKQPKGLLINFNVSHIYSEGQRTFVTDLYKTLPQ